MKSSFKFRLLASFITVTCLFVSLSPTVCASNGNDKVIKVGFFAFDGYHMVDDQGNPVPLGKGGFLVIKKPWPSMFRTLYKDEERFKDVYWNAFPG